MLWAASYPSFMVFLKHKVTAASRCPLVIGGLGRWVGGYVICALPLLLFNAADELTLDEIQHQTGIEARVTHPP